MSTPGISELLTDFILETTKKLVDNPNEVNVKVVISTKTIIVQIKVDKSDCGKIIGKKGRTIDSLKVISLAMKNTHFPKDSRKVTLEVIEDENSTFKYNDE